MNNEKLKAYAITLVLKPKPDEFIRYQSKMYRGFSLAKNPADAKEQCIQQFMHNFDPNKKPVITRDVIFIKECKLHNDFMNKTE